MTDALKRQMFYAGGTLSGWAFAKGVGAREMVPYTIMGGLLGFALAESMVGTPRPRKQPALSGAPKRSAKRRR